MMKSEILAIYSLLFFACALFVAVVVLLKLVYRQADDLNKYQRELAEALTIINTERRRRLKAENDLRAFKR